MATTVALCFVCGNDIGPTDDFCTACKLRMVAEFESHFRTRKRLLLVRDLTLRLEENEPEGRFEERVDFESTPEFVTV